MDAIVENLNNSLEQHIALVGELAARNDESSVSELIDALVRVEVLKRAIAIARTSDLRCHLLAEGDRV